MKKRIFSLILATLLLLGCASGVFALQRADKAADVDEDGVITARDAAIVARYLARWQGYVAQDGSLTCPDLAGLPEGDSGITEFSYDRSVDMKGREFRILTGIFINKNSGNEYTQYSSRPEIDGSGDAKFSMINAAAVARNTELEEKYNCTISPVYTTNVAGDLRASILSGSDDYDLVNLPVTSYSRFAASGFLLDLNEISTVKTELFDDAASSAFTVEGKLFAAIGSATPSIYRAAYGILADRDSIRKKTGTDILTVVQNGEWTVSKLIEIAESCAMTYDLGSIDEVNVLLFMGAGGSFSTYNSGAGSYGIAADLNSAANSAALSALAALESHRTNVEGGSVMTKGPFTCYHLSGMFSITVSKDYAIIPLPKANASDSYRTVPTATRTAAFAIPATVRNQNGNGISGFASPELLHGFFLSAFFCASDENDLCAAYREQLLNLKMLKTTDLAPKTACLDLLLNSVSYDYAYFACRDAVTNAFTVSGTSAFSTVPARYNGKLDECGTILDREMVLIDR